MKAKKVRLNRKSAKLLQNIGSDQTSSDFSGQSVPTARATQADLSYDYMRQTLQNLYPNGHPLFNDLVIAQMKLHSDKNKGYAEGGGPLGNFERCAKILAMYPHLNLGRPEVVAWMFMTKHIDRVLWDLNLGRVPSDEALADISVYAQIIRCMRTEPDAAPGTKGLY